jgi:hypothetical protein
VRTGFILSTKLAGPAERRLASEEQTTDLPEELVADPVEQSIGDQVPGSEAKVAAWMEPERLFHVLCCG